MRQSVRVIVFNADEDYSATLRSDLLGLDGVQIVAEVNEPGLLDQAVDQFHAEILVVHLDPNPDAVLPLASHIASTRPQLNVFVLSESTDGRYVLAAMRAGIREFLTKPIDGDMLARAIEKVTNSFADGRQVGTLVSIIGTVGGVGSSCLATNLAVEIADLTEKGSVALVDLDFRYGQLGTMLDLQADYTVADLSETPEQIDAAMIQRAMVKHSSGVHLLARPNSFAQADQITAAHCVSVLSSLQQIYDYVVVDGPNRFDPGGMAVLDLSDVNLLLVQLLVTSVRNVLRMLDELRGGGYNLNRFSLVCNRVGQESAHLEIPHVEATLNRKVDYQIPDDWRSMSVAVNMGVPLAECAPRSKCRMAIRNMAEAIVHPDDEKEATQAAKSGLLGRIFSGAS